MSIVITGIGTVGPHGVGTAALAAALADGTNAATELEPVPDFHSPSAHPRYLGRVDPAALAPHLDPRTSRRMSLPSRLAVVAARLARADAGLEAEHFEGHDVAVCLGTAFGPTDFTIRLLDQIRDKGPEAASPFLFMESVANAHAGQVALDAQLVGPNATIVQREASALSAVAQGVSYLASGRCELALVGAVDEIAPMTHGALERFGALSSGPCGRALDAARDGYAVSEGATVLVLERDDTAHARGARVLARVRTALRGNDPTASAVTWGDGAERLGLTLRLGLERAGLTPFAIDRVVSGASGSRRGDRLEALLLRQVLGDTPPSVLTPKAVTGEFGGGFLAAAVLAATGADFGPTPGFESVDPELGLRPHDGRPLERARTVLVSSLAAGGAAAWLVLEAGEA